MIRAAEVWSKLPRTWRPAFSRPFACVTLRSSAPRMRSFFALRRQLAGKGEFMRLFLVSAILFPISVSSLNADYDEAKVIAYTKQITVSQSDITLPKQSLERWLKSFIGKNEITWEVNDCGESDGSGTQEDVSLCGAFSIEISPNRRCGAWISVGSVKEGIIGNNKNWPHIFRAFVEGNNGVEGTDLKALPGFFSKAKEKD